MTTSIAWLPLKEMTSPEEAEVVTTITVGSVVVLGLAAVGAYVVAKKGIANAKANWKIRKEMKALYPEHRKVR